MRLAHVHIPHLIPYAHSLRLQNALVERQFAHKDWLRRAAQRGGEPTSTSEPEKSNHVVHSDAEAYKNGRTEHHSTGTGLRSSSSSSGHSPDTDRRPIADGDPSRNLNPNPRNGNRSHTSDRVSITGPGSAPNNLTSSWFDLESSPPDPTLLTFSTLPTYTVGRRHLLANPISSEQQAFLTANGRATFHASPRGGLLTYHAPGQLTGYIVVDLRRHGITARCWVRLLEESVIRTCAAWGVPTTRTDDPGVWIKDQQPSQELPVAAHPLSDRKICAIGVQVSRGVTAHGIGLNVFDAALPTSTANAYDFTPAQKMSGSYSPLSKGYLSWGFSRIVACGLEGKSVTWLTRERGRDVRPQQSYGPGSAPEPNHREGPSHSQNQSHGRMMESGSSETPIQLESVGEVFAQELCHGLNSMRGAGKESVDGVYRVQEADVLSWERKP
ncbi:hypothetical protein A1O3_09871 [Capronia epimyces CBS 606.96]|uniref:lipoyl(octanoyl) transferase n=1 Tax=Capronia epimyces CBS 606.96 TaxID=1182542 RepID=W9XBN8_9EURO|nr:uncharacterized protein A1O3_09871 [Capronia epimyces CBS 606.96]EXJ77643.1 hypothetical protein A1O3_09871 [Capronia epimyces CBS 606.96]